MRFRVSFPLVNPKPTKQATTAKKVQRHILCEHYGACLDKAIEQGWPGFSCAERPDFLIEEPENVSYWQVQTERTGRILKRIFVDAPPKYGS